MPGFQTWLVFSNKLSTVFSIFTTMEQIESQIKEINKELRESPEDAGLLNELGVGYQMLGEYDKAVKAYQKSLTQNPDNYKVHFNLANTLFEIEQIDRAISHYLDALDIQPDYVPALNNLADVYELAEDHDRARELFEYITKINPDDPMGYFNLGNHHLRSNSTVEAGRCYKKAIELDQQFYEAYNNIGFILKHLGKYKEAASYFEQCLEIAPDYEPAEKDLAACKRALKNE